MEGWLWALSGILAVMVAMLCVKIHWMHKAADEIREAFEDIIIRSGCCTLNSSNCMHCPVGRTSMMNW